MPGRVTATFYGGLTGLPVRTGRRQPDPTRRIHIATGKERQPGPIRGSTIIRQGCSEAPLLTTRGQVSSKGGQVEVAVPHGEVVCSRERGAVAHTWTGSRAHRATTNREGTTVVLLNRPDPAFQPLVTSPDPREAADRTGITTLRLAPHRWFAIGCDRWTG